MSQTDLTVSESSHVGRARQLAAAAAQRCGLSGQRVHLVSLATTELATNLIKHARRGVLTFVTTPGRLDVLSVDRGPGIRRLRESLRDGYSTTGTLGAGLGAVRRASDVFDAYSLFGSGTVVLARWHAHPPRPDGVRVGAALSTAPGETTCGDMWTVARTGATVTVAVSDGLGHGEAAARASDAAIDAIISNTARSPSGILTAIQPSLAPTRGATVAVAQFTPGQGRVRFAGIGNVAGRLYPEPGGRAQSLVSRPGIVGAANALRATEFVGAWSARGWLVLHTDGVSERWSTEQWPGLFGHDPSVVAGWVLGQHGRGRDDACVVVIAGGQGVVDE